MNTFCCPRKMSTGMLKTGPSPALPELTYAVKQLLQYSTVNRSRLPICPNTTTPEQQMNKFRVQTPFPNGTVARKTLASTNNLSSRVQSNKK